MKELKLIRNLSIIEKATILISLVCFIISLTQPSFYVERNSEQPYLTSIALLFMGWMSFIGGGLHLFAIWGANPLYFLSIILTVRGKKVPGFYTLIIATCLAVLFSQLESIPVNEAGSVSEITSFGLGYKLWVSSFIILTAGLILNAFVYDDKKK